MRDFFIGDDEQIPEMDVKNAIIDFMVDDEDFNRAVAQLSDDSEYISSKLASLEDNNSVRTQLEDSIVTQINSSIPGLENSSSFQSIMSGISDLAEQGMAYNEILAESIADAMTATSDTVKRIGTSTGIVTGGILLGSTGLPFGWLAIGAVAYKTFKNRSHRSDSATEGLQEVAEAIKGLNSVIDEVVETSRIFSVVREDFQAMWNNLMNEEPQEV